MSRCIEITVTGGHVRATCSDRGRATWAAEATYADDDDLAKVLAELAVARPSRVRRARVALGADVAVVKSVAGLPPMKPADLTAHVQLRSRRYFLQNGIPLVTAAAPGEGAVLAAAAEAPLVEAISRGLAAAGLDCVGIAPATEPSLGLETDAARAIRRERSRAHTRRWAVACGASLVLALASWIGAPAWRLRRDTAELGRLRAATQSALVVRANLDETTTALTSLAGVASQRSRMAQRIAELTRALPDSTVITALNQTSLGGTMSGYAAHSSDLVQALSRAAPFTSVTLDGAVSHETVAGRDWERFTLRLGFRP